MHKTRKLTNYSQKLYSGNVSANLLVVTSNSFQVVLSKFFFEHPFCIHICSFHQVAPIRPKTYFYPYATGMFSGIFSGPYPVSDFCLGRGSNAFSAFTPAFLSAFIPAFYRRRGDAGCRGLVPGSPLPSSTGNSEGGAENAGKCREWPEIPALLEEG